MAVTDVAGDDLRIVEIEPGQLCADLGHVLVAGSVEAVLAYAVFLVIGVGQGVHVVDGGDRLVERSVEHRDLLHARKYLLDRKHAFEVGGVVQRGDFEQRADFRLDILGDDAAFGEELAAVGDAVADGFHLFERGDHAVFCVRKGVEDQFDAGRVVGNRLVEFERLLADGFMDQVAFREADAFYDAFCKQFARCSLHVDHLILDRRRAAVQYQNYHKCYYKVICFCSVFCFQRRLSPSSASFANQAPCFQLFTCAPIHMPRAAKAMQTTALRAM